MKNPLRGVNNEGYKLHGSGLVSRVDMLLIARYNGKCNVILQNPHCKNRIYCCRHHDTIDVYS